MERVKQLYELYKGPIMRYFLRLTGNKEDAVELTQETFYQACLSIHRFGQRSSAKTWLFAIARNVYLKSISRRGRDMSTPWGDKPFPEMKDSEARDPGEMIVIKEEWENIAYALLQLSETARTILILKEYEQLSYEEISEIFGQSVNWARVTFFRAKKQLYKVYQELQGDDVQ
ncbi:MAG: RNA polymerase sigma factor [Peptococcaceae bacterium]